MISRELAKEVLDACLVTGGDFAELYYENTTKNQIVLTSKNTAKETIKKLINVLMNKP